MKQSRVAARYAKSLIALAQEQGNLEEVYSDMQLVNKAVEDNRELELLLESSVVKADKKASVLKAIFSDKISTTSMKFMDILVSKRREHLIDDVSEQVEIQYQSIKGIVSASVVSASGLTEDQRKEVLALVDKMSAKDGMTVNLAESIDPELIGGFILQVGDHLLDYSVSGKLEKFRQEFSKNQYIAEF